MEPEGSLPYSPVPATCPRSISPGPKLSVWTFCNKIRFYGEDLLAPRPTLKLEDHPLSAVRDCVLFSIFAAVLHMGSRSSIRALPWWQGPTYHGIYIYIYIYIYICISRAQQPLVDQGLLIIEASQSHSIDTPHSVELLWTSNQPNEEISTWQQTIPARDRHPSPPAGFEPAIATSERLHTAWYRNKEIIYCMPVICNTYVTLSSRSVLVRIPNLSP